ncbi:MAG: DegT/DnrJ/EryC1/StrS family aminotransferase [Ruminococcaceae bacterium]|nr:DegT/DnrJ/EryC1/StrS family aminotransferase [Oscillospiraceae bacterium]
MEMKKINVTRSSMPSYEEYCEEIKSLWDSRWLSNRGMKHREFEEMLQKYLGADKVALFANGHVALEVAIDAFGFKKGSEVITTPYTHCSTTHSIARNGLIPVFCDINDVDYTIDASKIEELITDKTCAIVATHVYGYVCDVKKIEEIAKKHNLKVIYDAAHAFGVTIGGVGVGTFGDAAMFSCHATKVFHTIEGGITTFKEEEIFKKVDQLTNFGFTSHESVAYVSTNARMNEYEAAMGICNLRHIDDEIAKRKLAADRYVERLSGVEGIKLIAPQEGVRQNYSYFPVFFDGYKMDRNEVQAKLAENNVFARKYFYPLTNELECYAKDYGYTVENTPVAKHAAECVLTLPMYADLTVEDVDRICDIILN